VTLRSRECKVQVQSSRVSARIAALTGVALALALALSRDRGTPHDDSTPAAEPMTRVEWIAYHVARAPKITQRQWADMLLLLHYGNQETSDDDQDEDKAS
jgi:hypothetical protein